jgi:hypothetical protein
MFVRPVNVRMTQRAVLIARISQIMRRAKTKAGAFAFDARRVGVTFQTEQAHLRARQHLGIGRTVWRVTGLTAFCFDRRMLKDKRPLFVRVAFQTRHIARDRIAQLLGRKAAVLVVAIRTFHAAFGNLVMERLGKGRFLIGVALVTHIRLCLAQQKFRAFGRVRGMAIQTRNAVPRVFAAPEVEAFFALALRAFVTGQADGGSLFGREFAEGAHGSSFRFGFVGIHRLRFGVLAIFDKFLGGGVKLDVLFRAAVTGFAAALVGLEFFVVGFVMRRQRVLRGLIAMAFCASIAADILTGVLWWQGGAFPCGIRCQFRGKQNNHCRHCTENNNENELEYSHKICG